MYWKVEEFQDNETGMGGIVFNYFEVVKAINQKSPWYNGFLKCMIYPNNLQMVVKAAVFETEEDFIEWYHQHKQL